LLGKIGSEAEKRPNCSFLKKGVGEGVFRVKAAKKSIGQSLRERQKETIRKLGPRNIT